MNPYYIYNSPVDRALNKFSYRPYPLNKESYFELKKLNYHKNNIYKPNLIVDVTPKFNYSLPFNHGHYNEFEHLNTYSTHSYVPVTHCVNMLFPNVGTVASIMKRR
jgi:hypothetical protein